MINIFFAKVTEELSFDELQYLQSGFSNEMKRKFNSFRRWQDSHATLFGKILLKEALNTLDVDKVELKDILADDNNKPYFDHAINFNISHAGQYVLCAVSFEHHMGIDIEFVDRGLDIHDFTEYFTREQWNSINNSEDPVFRFFEYWTMKEAVIKADGRGLGIPLQEVIISNDKSVINKQIWSLKKLDFGKSYAAHMAVDSDYSTTEIREIDVYQIAQSR